VLRRWTTISCRAFALSTVLLAFPVMPSAAADQPPAPRLPLTTFWSRDPGGPVSLPPVSDGDRVFLALKSAHLTARAAADGQEVWRLAKDVSVAMAAAGGLLFISAGDAVEAIRGADGANAWTAARIKAVAPLIVRDGWVIAVTDAEIVAISAKDGTIAWRHAAGGVRIAPAIDGPLVYAGAEDGRLVALTLASGALAWEKFLPGGVTALTARAGRVYAGAGDKQFYCLDGKSGKARWPRFIGSSPIGRIAVDDERVYFTALNNVVYALDRATGNQRWTSTVRSRPIDGVMLAGHVAFVPAVAPQLFMFFDRDGHASGAISLPSDMQRDIAPAISEDAAGITVLAVTANGLANEWQITRLGTASEAPLVKFSDLTEMPGVPFLTDPVLEPIGRVLGTLLLADPVLRPLSSLGWPVVMQDPPLEPLTTLPGLQLRPLSPVLPTRRGG
jgi:outer membrane protein assembly factor BamB